MERLPHNESFPTKPRDDLDRSLQVARWTLPGGAARDTRGGKPHWWHGDEDASQGFLMAMGVMSLG